MSQSNESIPIGLALANCDGVDGDEVYDFIATAAKDTTAFAFKPRGPAAAALDFYLLLDRVADIASIAALLWFAYDKFIGSRKPNANDSSGMYIAVRRPDGTVIDIFLGRDVIDKAGFVQRFELLVGDAKHPEMRVANEQLIRELELDAAWKKFD